MARINNLTNFLNDVAAAIKEKLGDNTNIPAAQFDTKIREIETGGDYQSKTVNISANGSQTITPDSEYDALSSVVINVQVPVKQLQSKAYEFTDNTHIVLSPETGYDGFSSVELTINVPTGSGDVKLFETEQAMQADPNPQEGDLAIIYRNETTVPSPGDTISSITPPATVVFDTAISGTKTLNLRGTNVYLQCRLTASQFRITDMRGIIYPDIRYTSSDGLTYTRTDTGAASYDLGEEITIPSTANTNILQFFQTGGVVFEGLYQYSKHDLEGNYRYFMDTRDTTDLKISELPFELPDIDTYTRVNALKGENVCTQYSELIMIVHTYHLHSSGLYNVIDTCTVYQTWGGYLPRLVLYNNSVYASSLTYVDTSSLSYIVKDEYDFSLDTPLVSTSNRSISETLNPEWSSNLLFGSKTDTSLNLSSRARGLTASGDYMLRVSNVSYGIYNSIPKQNEIAPDSTVTLASSDVANPFTYQYDIAPTQLTLENASQLSPEVLGYGKNGLVTGDGTIYNSTPPLIHLNTLYGESLGEYAGSNETFYFPQSTNTQTPVSAPEEIVKIHWLKSKGLVENNDKLVLAPQAEYEEFGTTTSDGRYTIKYAPDTAPANSYLVIDHQTQEEWIWTPGSEGRNTPHVSGHKAYFIYWSPVDGSYVRFLLEVYSYDFETRTSTQLVHYTFSDTYTTDPTLMSTNAYICPDLDFWYIITNRSVSSKYSLYLIGGKLSQANDVHIIYRNFEHSGYVTGSSTFSSDGHLWFSVSEDYGSSATLLEYSLETFTLLNTYGSNTCGLFSYNINHFYRPVAYTDGTYLYALTGRGHCKINFRNSTYETYDQPMPVFCDYQNGNYFSYGSLTDAYNTVLKIYGNKNLQVTKQYQISRMTRSKMNATSTPFFIPLGEQDGKVLLTDYSRPVQGIPYTNGTILDHDMSLTPIGCNTSTLLFLYTLTKKSDTLEPDYTQLIATARDNLWAYLNMQGEISAEDELEDFYAQDPEVLTNDVVRFYLTSGMGTWDVDTEGNCTSVEPNEAPMEEDF